jgi:hypothetical protein
MRSNSNDCSWVEIVHADRISVHELELSVDDCRIEVHSWLLDQVGHVPDLPRWREFTWTGANHRFTRACGYHVYFGLSALDAITLVLLGVAKTVTNPYPAYQSRQGCSP